MDRVASMTSQMSPFADAFNGGSSMFGDQGGLLGKGPTELGGTQALDFGGGQDAPKENFSQNAPSPGGADLFGSGSDKVSDLLKDMLSSFFQSFKTDTQNGVNPSSQGGFGASIGPVGGKTGGNTLAVAGADQGAAGQFNTRYQRPVEY
ncbi:hypothetical protein ACKC9G_13355 [Pokkaliibacter sp. CJK22405]|uniref:hypothetical protein n=1 Tax=Pokkaliibacter sp. CJK22405 TaxID=3384615 RepID=UPI0039848432